MRLRWLVLSTLVFAAQSWAAELWTVEKIEALALSRDEQIKAIAEQIDALTAQASFDESLPDPQVVLAARNLPTDSFSMTQEPMTQVVIGVQQRFPAGDTLSLKAKARLAEQERLKAELQLRQRQLRLQIRQMWVDWLYWRKLERLLKKQDEVYAKLESVALSLFRVGKRAQQDIFRIKTVRAQIEEQQVKARQQADDVLVRLARWVPELKQAGKLASHWPNWNVDSDIVMARGRLLEHPMLKASQASVLFAKRQLALAEAAYQPDWRLGVSYGIRGGNTMLGEPRSDFVSIDFAFSLPWQPANRQDKQVHARQKQLLSAEFRRDDVLASLKARLDETETRIRWLIRRIAHFDQNLLVVSDQNRQAALDAYQRNTADFNDPMLAYDQHLRLRVQRLLLQKTLLASYAEFRFLTGEWP